MNRLHLFELEDQSWFPDVIRKGITDYLQFAANRIDLYRKVMPVIKKGLEKSGTSQIIDLGSGGGGGTKKVFDHLQAEGVDAKITLTDKFPNLDAFKAWDLATNHKISYVPESVDATAVPVELKGLRTMFVAFHHFKPADASHILEDAVHNNAPIAIFEATERSVVNFIAMLFSPLAAWVSVPFIKPFSWARILFTYIIPLIPIALTWDGLVSVLRTYSVREMKEMTAKLNAPDYEWEYGRIKTGKGPVVVYLLGYPKK